VVKSLEQRGWVVIATPSHDRRATLVHAKKEVIAGARKVLAAEIAPHLATHLEVATSAELKTILRGLAVLVDVLQRQSRSRAD
jgi:DNA-binding MarR family transcriptional regulator